MVSKICHVVMSLLVITVFMIGCADVPSSGPTPPDPKAQMRFVNADPGLGSVAVTVDGAAAGTVAYGAATAYGEYPAGSRKVALNPGTAADTARISFTTDRRSTLFILPQSNNAREYYKINERYLYEAAGVATRALVRVVNMASIDAGVDAEFVGPDTVTTSDAVAYKSGAGYFQVKPGNYTFTISEHGQTTPLATGTITVAVNKRYSYVLLGTAAAPALVNLVDD